MQRNALNTTGICHSSAAHAHSGMEAGFGKPTSRSTELSWSRTSCDCSTKAELEDDVLGQVGRDTRRLLRPRDAQPAGPVDRLGEPWALAARGPRGRYGTRRQDQPAATEARRIADPSGSSPSVASNPSGALGRPTRAPGLIPSVRGSGVPYPIIESFHAGASWLCGARAAWSLIRSDW
jgi:hypothetical protein